MARALSKVQKKVAKKRGGKLNALHENSRDSQRLRRAGAREEKIAKIMQAAKSANQVYVYRVAWFQDAISEHDENEKDKDITDQSLHDLTTGFISRLDEEFEEAKSQRRPGRPPSSLESQLKLQQDTENKEYKSGLWVPDVRDKTCRERLERWSGEWAGMNTLKFVRVMKDGTIKDSSFPPKGLS